MSFLSDRRQRKPVFDELNLVVDISSVKPEKEFRFITRIMFGIQWAAAAISFAKFGADNVLAKGLQLKYGTELILPMGLISLNEFSDIAYDCRIDSDAQATPQHHMICRLSFFKIVGHSNGIWIGPNRQLSIEVQDDLSGTSNNKIHATFEGWLI